MVASACVEGTDLDVVPGEEAPAGELDPAEAADTAEGRTPDDGDAAADGEDGDAGLGSTGGQLPVGALPAPADYGTLEEVSCSFDEQLPLPVRPTCYEVAVPEDWSDPDPQDQVILQAAVFHGDGSSADANIYFDGGPGAHTLDTLAFSFGNFIQPLLDGRDFIVFDQRGVGSSEPALDCPEITEVYLEDLAGLLDPESAASAQLDAQDACRDRLVAAGVNLEAYNSIASANDVEAMRSLLGHEQLNVIGISYGTRLAQTYMRMYPESIRSVVLDSVFPTGYDLWSNFDPEAIRAFEQLFAGCAASPDCAEAYPEFEDRFSQLLDQLDAEPAGLETRNLLDGTLVPLSVDGDDLMSLVFSALYNRAQFAAVPQMVEDGLEGRYDTIELFGSVQVSNISFVSHGMRLSVECNEEIPFESIEVLEANRPTEPPYSRLANADGGLTLFELCDRWPAGTAPEVESQPIGSDLPTLLLAGRYDPITPPAGADAVAAGLTNSYPLLFPHEGHGIAPTSCGAQVVGAFIADPSVEPDATCLDESPEPVWTTPEVVSVELVEFEVDGLVSISGLRPAGWTDAGNGVFARQQTVTDPTILLLQPTGGLPADNLINLLAGQLDLPLEPGDPLEVDGVTWDTFTTAEASAQAARAAISPGPRGVLVLLVANADEIDALYDQLFEQVAASARPG